MLGVEDGFEAGNIYAVAVRLGTQLRWSDWSKETKVDFRIKRPRVQECTLQSSATACELTTTSWGAKGLPDRIEYTFYATSARATLCCRHVPAADWNEFMKDLAGEDDEEAQMDSKVERSLKRAQSRR